MINKLRQVSPELFRGSAPSPKDVQWLQDNLGIKKIVSLDEQSGEAISRVCKLLGINQVKEYVSFNKGLMHLVTQDLRKLFLEGGPTFVHCLHGKDRTGLAVALVECKYLGESPDQAIKEAKKLGFGIGMDPKITSLYEKLILACKPDQDENHADIVSNEREYIGDNRDSFIGGVEPGSFAPYLDATKTYPADVVYNPINDQEITRQNYGLNNGIEESALPDVGIFNNDAGLGGVGPTINMTGFIYD